MEAGATCLPRSLSALGVGPAEAVFMGDTLGLDVVGPQQIGTWTMQIGQRERDGARPDARISTLSDLPLARRSLGFSVP